MDARWIGENKEPHWLSGAPLNRTIYRLSSPVEYSTREGKQEVKKSTSYVVVSSSTYGLKWQCDVFPATESGDILDFLPLGEFGRDEYSDHDRAIRGLGWNPLR